MLNSNIIRYQQPYERFGQTGIEMDVQGSNDIQNSFVILSHRGCVLVRYSANKYRRRFCSVLYISFLTLNGVDAFLLLQFWHTESVAKHVEDWTLP